jgi:hypothetical protein
MNADVCAKVGPDFEDSLEEQRRSLLNAKGIHSLGKGKGKSPMARAAAWQRHDELAGEDLRVAARRWAKGQGINSLGKGKSSHSLGKGKANVEGAVFHSIAFSSAADAPVAPAPAPVDALANAAESGVHSPQTPEALGVPEPGAGAAAGGEEAPEAPGVPEPGDGAAAGGEEAPEAPGAPEPGGGAASSGAEAPEAPGVLGPGAGAAPGGA